ncbi:MAG TPA: VOC family protein [Acidimicrobiia bacterium]|nr:VOC family protein [Acidimicrobiia bacterium]
MAHTQTLTTRIVAEDARALLEFVQTVFDAEVTEVHDTGRHITHSEVTIGNSKLFIASSTEEFGEFPAMLNVYVDDVDKVHALALENGAVNLRDPEDRSYGDRTGGVRDVEGNQWWIFSHVDDVRQGAHRRKMAELAAG